MIRHSSGRYLVIGAKKFSLFEDETGIIQEVDYISREGLLKQMCRLTNSDQGSQGSDGEIIFLFDEGNLVHFSSKKNAMVKSVKYYDALSCVSRVGNSNYFLSVEAEKDYFSIWELTDDVPTQVKILQQVKSIKIDEFPDEKCKSEDGDDQIE